MTAPRFFTGDVSSDLLTLTGDEARHAVKVLRIRTGEEITISDGKGTVAHAVVEAAGSALTARVTQRVVEPQPRPELIVFQAIPKHGKLDLVVQKLTEVGVGAIQLFVAERSVARWDGAKAHAQTERLGTIAREAAKQSRRAWLPMVSAPVPLTGWALPPVTVVLHEEASRRLTTALPQTPPEAVGLVVGPEGGLTEEEVATLRERAATPVSLGPLILRAETAALVAASVVLARYGLLG